MRAQAGKLLSSEWLDTGICLSIHSEKSRSQTSCRYRRMGALQWVAPNCLHAEAV